MWKNQSRNVMSERFYQCLRASEYGRLPERNHCSDRSGNLAAVRPCIWLDRYEGELQLRWQTRHPASPFYYAVGRGSVYCPEE